MDISIKTLVEAIQTKGLTPSVNLERPKYVQPEDLIKYRSARIIVILGLLNTKHGLSKQIIACIDFLLRNPGYQKRFIIEYFKDKKVLLDKLKKHTNSDTLELDFNIIRYKSVPWDLRFNDMFLYLMVRKQVDFIGEKPNLRARLSQHGNTYFDLLKEIFVSEVNFLETFGRSIIEAKTIQIITEVIPEAFWKENEKLNY